MTDQFCGACGTARTPGHAFCSGCGRPVPPPAAPAAPTRTAPPPPPPPPPPASAPQAEYLTPYQPPAPAGRRRSRAGLAAGIGTLALAVVGAGFVGWQVLGPQGGADSPEEAVEQFVTGVVEQDGVAVLDSLLPGEVSGFDEVYRAAQERAEEEGLTDGSSITDALTIEIDDLELDVDELGDGVAQVSVSQGDYTVEYDPDALPAKLAFVAEEEPEARTWKGDLAEVLALDEEDGLDAISLTTVEYDGGWYVTLLGSYVELQFLRFDDAYGDDGLREPDYDLEEVDPIVGEDPEEVIQNLAGAVNDVDVDAFLANLPADLATGLQPYARILEGELRDYDVRLDVAADDLELETEDLGDDLLKVTVDEARFTADATGDGDTVSGSAEFTGDCVDAQGTDEYGTEEESGCLGDVDELGDLGIDSFYLVLREVDGGYQLDPMATVATYAAEAVKQIPDGLIDDALDEIEGDVSEDDFDTGYDG